MISSSHSVRHAVNIKPVSKAVAELPCIYLPVENRSVLILNFKPGESFSREWFIRDNEQTVDLSFGKIVAGEWLDAVLQSQKNRGIPVGLGEDDVIYIW